jgi:6-phosphogluconate dehydrogenase
MAVADAAQNEIGVIGLDLMGRNVAFRLAEQSFSVAACDWAEQKTFTLRDQPMGPPVRVAANVHELMVSLRQPRKILIFSGPDAPMNLVLEQLLPELKIGDLVIDAGHTHFKDTAKHRRRLAERSVQFMGLGLGGGEKGARHGAMVMAGGESEACRQARPLLEAMAATFRGQPCVSLFETAAAAHFVKMVHAGIEYALLQLLSETFGLLQRTLRLADEELHDASGAWHIGVFNGHLTEISGRVFDPKDPHAPRLLLREKLASAKRDALGKWLAQCSWELETLTPTIEAAVEMQRVAAAERRQALVGTPFRHPVGRFGDDRESVLDELHGALQAAMLITYAQGLSVLGAASRQFGFRFNLLEIARAWRGCTHLRTSLLDDITAALEATPGLPDLLSDDDLSQRVMASQEDLRHAVWRAHLLDTGAPALLASLDYLDFNRAAWWPVNLVQPLNSAPLNRNLNPSNRNRNRNFLAPIG